MHLEQINCSQRERVQDTVSVVLIVSFLILLNALVFVFYQPNIEILLKRAEELLLTGAQHVRPEPVEKFQFLLTVLALPAVSFVAIVISRKADDLLTCERLFFAGRLNILLLGCLGASVAFFNLYSYYCYSVNSLTNSISGALAYFFCLFPLVVYAVRFSAKDGILARSVLFFCCTAGLLFLLLLIINGFFSVHGPYPNLIHLNACFYAVSQVFAGKHILVDVHSQYGLFPHFLKPIFLVFGLSLESFACVMSLLNGIAYVALLLFLIINMRSRLLASLGFLAILYHNYWSFHYIVNDAYYQYWPIRLLFPSVMMALAALYFANRSRFLYWLLMLLSSVAVLWNVDAGVVTFISWVLSLCYWELINKDFKPGGLLALAHAGCAAVCLVAAISSYTLYTWLSCGFFPDWMSFFRYQKIFYEIGFYMMPMNSVHPWNFIALIYIVGIWHSVKAYFLGRATNRSASIFLSSLVGIGSFSYYQGRSHDYVLFAVLYPCIILISLFVDSLLIYIKESGRKDIPAMIIFGSLLCVMGDAAMSLIVNGSNAISASMHGFEALGYEGVQSIAYDNISFVNERSRKGEEVVILADGFEGIYYAHTQSRCPLSIPGSSELLLKSDYEVMKNYLVSNKDAPIFVDNVHAPQGYESALSRYVIASSASSGGMHLALPGNPEERELLPLQESTIYDFYFDNHLVLSDKSRGEVLVLNTFRPEKERGTYSVSCDVGNGLLSVPAVQLEDEFAIQVVLNPALDQTPYAVVIGNQGVFTGFALQRNGTSPEEYTFAYGDGISWLPGVVINLKPGVWHYLVISVSSNSLSAFVDGEKVAQVNSLGPIKNNSQNLWVGNWEHANRPYRGRLQAFRMLSRGMDAIEVGHVWDQIKMELQAR